MGIICWICTYIIKADFTPSFKVGNFNFLKSAAALEGIAADRGYGVWNHHRSQAAAAIEGIVADIGDGVGNFHRCQTAAVREGTVADRSDGVPDAHRSQAAAFPVSACCCISMCCRLKDRKVGEVGLWRGEGWRFNGFNVIYEGLDST